MHIRFRKIMSCTTPNIKKNLSLTKSLLLYICSIFLLLFFSNQCSSQLLDEYDDVDQDGVEDYREDNLFFGGTSCNFLPDCDGDGLLDRDEISYANSEGVSCIILIDCDSDGVADSIDITQVDDTGGNCIINPQCGESSDVTDSNNTVILYPITDITEIFAAPTCFKENDCDSDGVLNDEDVDVDGNGFIEIYTIEQLNSIRDDLNGDGIDDGYLQDIETRGNEGCPLNGCVGYELARNLDFYNITDNTTNEEDRLEWLPISKEFAAIFSGGGYVIKNLYTTAPEGHLFENTNIIQDLHLQDANIQGQVITISY